MELIDLYKLQQNVIRDICQERYEGIFIPTLRTAIKNYKRHIANYAQILRQEGNLTHQGRRITTKPDFKRACIKEKWFDLLEDAQEEEPDNA